MFKKLLHAAWTFSLEKGWNWIWSKTEIDEKAIEVVEEIQYKKVLVKEELKDVVNAVKGIPSKPKKKYYKPKPKTESQK
jgi:coenzyme F420-reducing hydrogenase beta subunit